MFNKLKHFIKNNVILSIGLILCVSILSSYAYTKVMPQWFSGADTYNVVKEAFLTDKGYSNELSKHMSEQVFKGINIYNTYGTNKPISKVDFSLKEDSRFKVIGKVYMKMTYSVKIMDSQDNIIGGSSNIPITFTIQNIKGEWCITKKDEPA